MQLYWNLYTALKNADGDKCELVIECVRPKLIMIEGRQGVIKASRTEHVWTPAFNNKHIVSLENRPLIGENVFVFQVSDKQQYFCSSCKGDKSSHVSNFSSFIKAWLSKVDLCAGWFILDFELILNIIVKNNRE